MEPPPDPASTDPALPERISDIIRRHSGNRVDIRRAALEGVAVARAHRILDLGCGRGFAIRPLQGLIPPEATITGVDGNPENRVPFLAAAAAAGGRGSFLCRPLRSRLEFPDRTFDLAIASYSLYFFPGVIPEVARVLRPGGSLVAITHSEAAFSTLLWVLGVPPERSALQALTRNFSAENGAAALREHFTEVEERPYPNALTFRPGDVAELLTLVRDKAPLLVPREGGHPRTPAEIEEVARDLLRSTGEVVIEKDDAIFVCRGPQPR
ncbi:MAG: class I SAM-dependent methyltransferase [Actinobacteria bacterium]|nr:class I SAM-dependent methyltransferase [Actinomycetota bacterium]